MTIKIKIYLFFIINLKIKFLLKKYLIQQKNIIIITKNITVVCDIFYD